MRTLRSPEAFLDFLSDESHAFNAPADRVEKVEFAETEEDICGILRDANEARTFVTVSGGGTGVTGARVPMQGGVVLSMASFLSATPRDDAERIAYSGAAGESVLFLDRERCLVEAPPGISLQELAKALPRDLFYPPDPTEASASLGGTIATNASGARTYRYGATRRWVEGLRVALGNGDILAVRRGQTLSDSKGFLNFTSEDGREYRLKVPTYAMPGVKHNAGLYAKEGMDLVDLFIGSEGILGVVTGVTLRLEKRPSRFLYDTAFFPSVESALACAGQLRGMEGLLSLEFFDENSLAFLREALPGIEERAKAALFVEIEGANPASMDALSKTIQRHGSFVDWCAYSERDAQGLKEVRHALPERVNAYLKERGSAKLGTDFAVPLAAFPEMMDVYRSKGEGFARIFPRDGVHYVLFGHIGDCHLHFNFIAQTADEMKAAKLLYVEMARKAIALGGTISAEHGVGKKRVPVGGRDIPYLELMFGRKGLDEIASVKKALDTNLVLNPGNIVPLEYYK